MPLEKQCENCHWNYDDTEQLRPCSPLVGICIRHSKWMQRETFSIEGEPTSRYDIHVSGLSTVGKELKAELPKIGE